MASRTSSVSRGAGVLAEGAIEIVTDAVAAGGRKKAHRVRARQHERAHRPVRRGQPLGARQRRVHAGGLVAVKAARQEQLQRAPGADLELHKRERITAAPQYLADVERDSATSGERVHAPQKVVVARSRKS